MKTYEQLAIETAKLVKEKRKAYGGAFENCAEFLEILYPSCVSTEQYPDMLILIRIFDKMMRVAHNPTAFGENPYQDIVGYGLLGMQQMKSVPEEKTNENETAPKITKLQAALAPSKPAWDEPVNVPPTLSGLEGTPCPCCSGARPDGTLHTESECDAEFARKEGP